MPDVAQRFLCDIEFDGSNAAKVIRQSMRKIIYQSASCRRSADTRDSDFGTSTSLRQWCTDSSYRFGALNAALAIART
jgi:hypothetical protein